MSTRLIMALLKKDLTLFTRDRFYFLITVVGLVLYIVIYLVMPQEVNEDLEIAIYAPGESQTGTVIASEYGIKATFFSTEEALQEAVAKNDYPMGIVIPENFLSLMTGGQKPRITLYYAPNTSAEMKSAVETMIRQAAYAASGVEGPFELKTVTTGTDRIGNQIPLRNRFIPFLILVILATESLSLASLISAELTQNTISALLVTPLRLSHLLSAKAISGIVLSLGQTVLFMLIIRGFTHEPLAVFLSLLLGSILVTGLGFFISSLSRDMMGVTAWGMLIFIIIIIPATGSLFPGLLSDWAQVLPSYHLVDSISQLVVYHADFSAVKWDYPVMLGWSAVTATAGFLTLRRRYQ